MSSEVPSTPERTDLERALIAFEEMLMGMNYQKETQDGVTRYTSSAFTPSLYVNFASMISERFPDVPMTFDVITRSISVGGKWAQEIGSALAVEESIKSTEHISSEVLTAAHDIRIALQQADCEVLSETTADKTILITITQSSLTSALISKIMELSARHLDTVTMALIGNETTGNVVIEIAPLKPVDRTLN